MTDWPHAPVHRFGEGGTYFVTGATYRRQHFYREGAARDALQALLFSLAELNRISLQAWTLFSNHYHLVLHSEMGESVRAMLEAFHKEGAREINARDDAEGRQVWFQFRDTQLTYEKSWLARLRYTHQNAVKHGLVSDATQYPWCSAGWFERTARPSFVETVRRFKIDRVNVYDDFTPVPR